MPDFKTLIYTVVAVSILVGSLVWKYRLANYDFRNKGVGGIVSFRSLPHWWVHLAMKLLSWAALILGVVMTVRAAMLLFL